MSAIKYLPLSLDAALIIRSLARLKVYSIADFILPVDNQLKDSIIELSNNIQELINTVAATTTSNHLNIQTHYETYVIRDICFIPDLILCKNSQSPHDLICQVIEILVERYYGFRLLNNT